MLLPFSGNTRSCDDYIPNLNLYYKIMDTYYINTLYVAYSDSFFKFQFFTFFKVQNHNFIKPLKLFLLCNDVGTYFHDFTLH